VRIERFAAEQITYSYERCTNKGGVMKESSKIIRSSGAAMRIWYARWATWLALLLSVVAMAGWTSNATARDHDGGGHHHGFLRMSGRAHGGYQPVSGSVVSLFEVGTTGYGSAPTLLATTTTNARGGWNIASFTCSPANAELYLTSVGGNAGLGTNSAINLLAAIGPCNSLPAFVNINEVTTVASVFALRSFITFTGTRTNIGAPATNATGLANAAAQVANLVNVTNGRALATTPGGNGAPPQATINTLADLLVTCVSSAGPSSAECTSLLADATPSSGTAPTNTASATFDIAANPINNVAELYTLAASAPFTPTLNASPDSWALLLTYTEVSLSTPDGTAIDSGGNIWMINASSNTLSKFNPVGVALSSGAGFTGGGLSDPFSLAIDESGNVWVSNLGNSSVSEFDESGDAISSATGYVVEGGSGAPLGLALDQSGNLWLMYILVDGQLNVPKIDELEGGNTPPFSCPSTTVTGDTGCPISPSGGYTGGGLLNASEYLAIDATGNVWLANTNEDATANSVSEFVGGATPPTSCPSPPSPGDTGCPISPAAGYSGGGLDNATGITVDAASKVWVSNFDGNSLSTFIGGTTPPASCSVPPVAGDTGCPLSPAGGYTGGGLNGPAELSSDSAGHIWAINFANSGVAEFTSTGLPLSPSDGFDDTAYGVNVAIDASGNVWYGDINTNTLRELIGLAAPVKTPTIGPPDLP
jgi:streptogramin lyase